MSVRYDSETGMFIVTNDTTGEEVGRFEDVKQAAAANEQANPPPGGTAEEGGNIPIDMGTATWRKEHPREYDQLQQFQIWSVEVGGSGYYDLVKADGKTADAEARRRMRAADPTLDAKLYLLGRVPKVLSGNAAILAEKLFAKWMAGEVPP